MTDFEDVSRWEIPRSWSWVSIGDVCDVIGGGTPSTADAKNFDGGDIPWITPADLSGYSVKYIETGARSITRDGLEGSGARLMPPGTVLFSSRAPIGYVAIAKGPVSTNQGFKSFIPPKGVSSDYLYYYLKHAKALAVELSSGTTFQEISGKKAGQIPLAVAPEHEQERIVEKLEELLSDLDAGVVALQRARANLKRYRAAVLKAAVEGRLTEKWRAAHPDVEPAEKLLARILAARRRKWEEAQLKKFAEKKQVPPKGWKEKYSEPVTPDVAGLPKLPEGWCWVTLDQLIERSLANGRSVPTADEGFPVLRLTALKEGYVDCGEQKIGAWGRKDAVPFLVSEGDFLIARGNGSLKLVGRGGMVRLVEAEVAFPDTMIRASITQESGVRGYVRLIWDSRFVRRQIESVARTSAGIYKVAQGDLERICIPLPGRGEAAVAVEEVERAFSVCDVAATQLNTGRLRSDILRQSILKRAFEGRLVPQDPKDEPAGELLARIRAERLKERGQAGGALRRRK